MQNTTRRQQVEGRKQFGYTYTQDYDYEVMIQISWTITVAFKLTTTHAYKLYQANKPCKCYKMCILFQLPTSIYPEQPQPCVASIAPGVHILCLIHWHLVKCTHCTSCKTYRSFTPNLNFPIIQKHHHRVYSIGCYHQLKCGVL